VAAVATYNYESRRRFFEAVFTYGNEGALWRRSGKYDNMIDNMINDNMVLRWTMPTVAGASTLR
jgi:hypothetical protein